MFCPACKTPQQENARYCVNCGADLQLESELTSPSRPKPLDQLADPLDGVSIDGRYRLDSLIGKGGMGSVYKATRLLIGDEVAIKILHTDQTSDPHAAERFQREARAAARLKHPNAVSIYDFGVSSDGLQYLVMDLIEGRSLREITKENGPLELSLVIEITSQVCAALDEAHRQHIIHRDIKPDNIILNSTPSGLRVKVLDFGIAKLRDESASHLTQTGSVMGTPHYMSPEQCLGEELDNRADIYSVGVVLYEMLCGRVPFNSPISTAVVVQHVNQPPLPLRTINPSVSPQVEAAVLHALEKRREARPPSASALAREITDAGRLIVHEDRWKNDLAKPLSRSIDDEGTVETRHPSVLSQPPAVSEEMAPTVHLASLHESNSPALASRSTSGNGAVPTAIVRQNVKRNYTTVAVATLLCVFVIAAIAWRFSHSGNTDINSPPNTQLGNEGTLTDPIGATNGKSNGIPTPPEGMIYMSGGIFRMGSDEGDQYSKPSHPVNLKPFFIDAYEVTCEQYKRCVVANKCAAPGTWSNADYPAGNERRPVTGVSWDDANAYARWFGKRLPTEEEWEYAARGSRGFKYPWGNSWKSSCANADKEGEARRGMVDVGSYNCDSSSGAKDMIGNAWEWTSSDWQPYPGSETPFSRKSHEKVIRGGSWDTPKESATAVLRAGYTGAGDKTGFRCAKDATP